MFLRRLKYPNTNGLILRRTFKQLYESHIVEMFREFPVLRDWWDAGHKALNFPNGSILFFGYAEHEVDMENFYSAQYADIMPDEAQMFSQSELEKLSKSNRCTSNGDIIPKMVFPFMPGVGKGLSYLKRTFVDDDLTPQEKISKWAFIKAFSWDNIEWARKELGWMKDQNGDWQLQAGGISEEEFYSWSDEKRRDFFILETEYGRNLASTTDDYLRDAWLYGKFDVFEGQIFPELTEQGHNLDQFTNSGWRPEHGKLLSAVDWADSGIAAGVQLAIDPDENLYALKEYYARNRTVTEHAAEITSLFAEYGQQDYTIMDLPVNNINQDNLFSIQDAFRRAGLHTVQAHRANIQIGLDLMKTMLKTDPNRVSPFTNQLGSPRLFISKRGCPNLWREMKDLQRTIDADTGKVKYIGDDHATDCVRYIAMSRPLAPERPKVRPTTLPAFHFDGKAQRVMNQFDKSFGKDPNEDTWFPKP